MPAIIHAVCDPDSPFKDEGRNLLIDEFGKHYGTYFSILDAISSGINTQSGIASMLGEKSIGGHLKKTGGNLRHHKENASYPVKKRDSDCQI